MTDYLVTWSIDIEAKSPREAAQMALAIMQDPENQATHFEIYNKRTGKITCLNAELPIGGTDPD